MWSGYQKSLQTKTWRSFLKVIFERSYKIAQLYQNGNKRHGLSTRKAEKLHDNQLDIKRIEGQKSSENYYRIRVETYRIGLEITEPQIIISDLCRVGIYKKFPTKCKLSML